MNRAGELIASLIDSLPPALLPQSGSAARTQALSLLPPSRGGAALECHLSAPAISLDLVVRVFRSDRDHCLSHSQSLIPSVEHFFRRWAEPSGGLFEVPYADLECDIRGFAREPFIGPMIDPFLLSGIGALRRAHRKRPVKPPASCFELAERVVRAFSAPPPGAPVLEATQRCYSLLPKDGFICHLTSLRTRSFEPEDALRLIVSLPRTTLASYLRAVRYPGDIAGFEAALFEYFPTRGRVDIDLDVHAGGPTPKISAYTTFYAVTPENPELAQLLAILKDHQAVAVDRITALESWLGWQPPANSPPRTLTFKLTAPTVTPSSSAAEPRFKAYFSLLWPKDRYGSVPGF